MTIFFSIESMGYNRKFCKNTLKIKIKIKIKNKNARVCARVHACVRVRSYLSPDRFVLFATLHLFDGLKPTNFISCRLFAFKGTFDALFVFMVCLCWVCIKNRVDAKTDLSANGFLCSNGSAFVIFCLDGDGWCFVLKDASFTYHPVFMRVCVLTCDF